MNFELEQAAIAAGNSTDSVNSVHLLRQWPSNAWLERWMHTGVTLILSEQALQQLITQPELIDALPVPPYALHSEIVLLEIQEELPASIIQLGDARWVELSIEAEQYMVWDNV